MLYELLKSQNFSGRDYDDFEVKIMDYGFATIRKWIREGDLISECRKASSWPDPSTAPDTVLDSESIDTPLPRT
ncbi:hypothetical protein CIP100275_02093 [Corynebacterium diphtheriae]|nr:hypothetical protein CIP100294_01945 [Corynebacterium diphtheriae]CAB0526450.1 hypothetical protein CIP100275_02093 [Corynebacterium diphtheriae]CAB0817457.1 hypothetical protein FRC0259_02129 [Corynebacterium diphtheriae]